MAQWLMSPFFLCERRVLRTEPGAPVYQADYHITSILVTNNTDRPGRLALTFYEAKSDGYFYLADWASGTLNVIPNRQIYYQPDPSFVYGSYFYTYGWFEIWMSLDEMAIEVSIRGISHNIIVGGANNPGGGGVVKTRADRVLDLQQRRAPLRSRIEEFFSRNPNYPYQFRHRNEIRTRQLSDIDLEPPGDPEMP